MQDNRNNQQQQDPTKQANPDTLAVSDEKQRTQEGTDQNRQKIPTGNERNEKTDTEGAQAGMGE